jgi:ubiquinone/menaquinone biosynthesis C-methylase UbiE
MAAGFRLDQLADYPDAGPGFPDRSLKHVANFLHHFDQETCIKLLEKARQRLSDDGRVIAIGCGPGFLCEQMAEVVGSAGQVLGVDASEDLLSFAHGRNTRTWLTYEHGDALELQVPNASFDAH